MRKYSSTPRMVNLILFCILTAGFGALAIYFTFLTMPWTWIHVGHAPVAVDRENMSLALFAMLGSLGVAGCFLSLRGLLASVKALKQTDDESCRRCFDYYFSLGYVVATALFCNAGWLILLTTKNFSSTVSVGFVVVVYIVALILVLIGTNIPLVKVYEDDDEGVGMGRILLNGSVASGLGVAVTMIYGGIMTLALNSGATATAKIYFIRYLVLGLIPCLGCLVACLGLRAHKKGNLKKASILLYSSLCVYGLGMIAAGILQTVIENVKTWKTAGSFMGAAFSAANNPTNMVLSYVFGAIVVVAAIVLIVITLKPKKKK